MTNENEAQTLPPVTFGEKYLRYRPFLVITQTGNAAKTAKTHKKDWKKTPDQFVIRETPMIVDRVSDKMLGEASIIIDILNTKLVKNRFDGSGEPEKILEYYLGKYSKEVTHGIQIWTEQTLGRSKADEIMAEAVAAD